MAAIHSRLQTPERRFVLLGSHGEELKKPFEKSWQETANYQHDDQKLLAHRGNYGVCGGFGDLHIVDCDDLARWTDLEILPLILPTFTIESRPGHRQFYVTCKEHFQSGGLFDPEKTELNQDGKPEYTHIGDLKAGSKDGICGGMVVGPGCKHPSGSIYTVVVDAPIAEVSREQLQSIIARFKTGKKVDGNQQKADDPGKNDKKRRYEEKDPLDSLRVVDIMPPAGETSRNGDELRGDHPVHGSANGGNYVINTAKNAWSCKRCESGGGAALAIAVKHGLISCSEAGPGELRGDLFKQVLKIANEKYGMAGKEEPKGPNVIDAFKAILEHEAEAEADPTFDKWEWRMQRQRVIWAVERGEMPRDREEKAHKFLKQYRTFLKKFGIDYDDLYPLVPIAKSSKEEFPPEIRAKALEILKTGNPVQYIADSCGKMVLGADKAFKKTVCCISSQNINSSSGLHPKFSGDSGGGKTFIIYMFAHHMPSEAVIKGSMSAKAGFYHSDGNRVLRILDDYQAGNEELDTVIKQTSSEFHAPYQHRTVANHAAMTLQIGSEQTWAITSVDSSQEVQVLNRQLPINADDSIKLTIEVNNLTIKRYCQGESQYPITETVLVSRCIMQILRDEGYIDVRIPFEERIEWLDTSNRRNPSIFMDLVIAHTAMFRYQRTKDADGFYLATDEDFLAAKALFTDNDAEELVKRLTARERDVIVLLTKKPDGLTRDDIAENLKIVPQRVTQILSGQKGQGGLKQKVQLRETKISEMLTLSDDLRRTVHKTVYSLVDYDKFVGFEGVVRLKPSDTPKREPEKPAPEAPRKQSKHDASIAASMEISNVKDVVSIVSKKEKEREERETGEDLPHTGSEKIEGLLGNEKKAYFAYSKELDSDQHTSSIPSKSLPPLVCVNCGEDLAGHSSITKNGKLYCTQVGCGYPPRGEVQP